MAAEGKPHLGVVIVGHVDAGKSTTTGHLLFQLGGMSERDLDKLRDEAKALGKDSFLFAFFLDKGKDERARGVTIQCCTKEFFTDKYHYTIIDAPGHRDFIKNMISGASQADVAVLMVPANKGGFETSIQKGNHKEGQVQGQTRQHARLCNLLGIDQVIVGINKMDSKSVNYSEERYNEIKGEVEKMLEKIGYKTKKIPFIPMSGMKGENLTKKTTEMPWYKGWSVEIKINKKKTKITGFTLLDAFNDLVQPPKRAENKQIRMPVSGVYKIKGVGDVITGRVEQGSIAPGAEVRFEPTGSGGKIFSVEMHHKSVAEAHTGDNVGLNVKGLPKEKMPRCGDVMVLASDKNVRPLKELTATVFVQDHPGHLKPANDKGEGGFTPSVHVRTGKAPCQLLKINWKQGKSSGGQKVDNPPHLQAGDTAEVVMVPKMPFTACTYDDCKGLARVACMDSNNLVMLGKISAVVYKDVAEK